MATILPIIRLNRKSSETVPIQIRITHKRTTCKLSRIGHSFSLLLMGSILSVLNSTALAASDWQPLVVSVTCK